MIYTQTPVRPFFYQNMIDYFLLEIAISRQRNTTLRWIIRYYRQVSNIRRTLVGNKIVDNSDVVGASPVGAAPTTSSLST